MEETLKTSPKYKSDYMRGLIAGYTRALSIAIRLALKPDNVVDQEIRNAKQRQVIVSGCYDKDVQVWTCNACPRNFCVLTCNKQHAGIPTQCHMGGMRVPYWYKQTGDM